MVISAHGDPSLTTLLPAGDAAFPAGQLLLGAEQYCSEAVIPGGRQLAGPPTPCNPSDTGTHRGSRSPRIEVPRFHSRIRSMFNPATDRHRHAWPCADDRRQLDRPWWEEYGRVEDPTGPKRLEIPTRPRRADVGPKRLIHPPHTGTIWYPAARMPLMMLGRAATA